VAKTDNRPTVESSGSSPESARQPTIKTNNLTPDQALEILQEAARRCQQSGISVQVAPFYRDGQQSVVIVLANVQLVDGNLVLALPAQ
jgi:hypothetical protein